MVRSHDVARPHHRGSVLVLIDTWPERPYRESPGRTVGSGMDPRSTVDPAASRRLRSRDAHGRLRPVCRRWRPRRAGPSMLRPDAPPSGGRRLADARPARSEAVRVAMWCGGSGHRSRSPSGGRRLPNHPVPSLAPTQSPGGHPPRNPLRCLPRPHAPQRSRSESCSRGEGAYPTVSEPSWPPRSPASRIGGPDRGITALAGAFLAMVALGAGCLTVAVEQSGAGALR